MKRSTACAVVAAVLFLAAASLAQTPAAFKVPFAFKIGAKNPAAGAYTVAGIKDGQITLKQEGTGKEYVAPFTEKLTPPDGAPAGARLVFDEVGDFAPSYTEYVTVYILSEVWVSGTEGYRVHLTKGAHKTKVVAAEAAK
jgi:hypothetical protein